MILETSNYYEVLEITPDATQQEIRQAYLRLKLAYSKDSVALYTLVSKDETDEILRKVEEAYKILSNEDRRREYDQNYSPSNLTADPFNTPTPATEIERPPISTKTSKVVSIDRVPPMDKSSREEDLVVAPIIDVPQVSHSSHAANAAIALGGMNPRNLNSAVGSPFTENRPVVRDPKPATVHYERGRSTEPISLLDHGLQEEVERETEWSGLFLRRIREARKISIEEMADFTKISRTYLNAIENEDYSRLPAATYVRGFVTQVAKRLRLPHDKVALAYLTRYKTACPDKS